MAEDWLPQYLEKYGREIRANGLGRVRVAEITGLSKDKAQRLVRAAKGKCHTIVSLWDVHVPEVFGPGWDTMLQWCEEHRPDEFILGGDFVELESASSYGGLPVEITKETEEAKRYLSDIRRVMPNAKGTYLEGNHETRLQRTINSVKPQLASAVKTIPELLELERFQIDYIPRMDAQKRGRVMEVGDYVFVHGYWANKYHANKHLDQYRKNVAYGHKHSPQMYCHPGIEGPQFAWCFPILRTRHAGFQDGKPSPWVNGFGVTYIKTNGTAKHYMILMDDDGSFVWNGVEYSPS